MGVTLSYAKGWEWCIAFKVVVGEAIERADFSRNQRGGCGASAAEQLSIVIQKTATRHAEE